MLTNIARRNKEAVLLTHIARRNKEAVMLTHIARRNKEAILLTHIHGQGGLSNQAKKVQEDSRCKGTQGNTSKAEIKCVCLDARSIVNKKTELNIMVDDIKPHIIRITESWSNNDIT